MPKTLADGSVILFDTINNNLRHEDYERVIEVATNYTIYATGCGISDKLKRFNSRESVAEHLQRLDLTITNVQDIFNSCVKPLYKVWRTPAQITLQWEGKDASKTAELRKELQDAGNNFWGKKDVKKYITQRQADLDSTDPNTFVVVEFKEIVNPADPKSKGNPYPFEVNSAEAIRFEFINNDLQWLIALNANIIMDKEGKKKPGEIYYMYLDNETIKATQISNDTVKEQIQLLNLLPITSDTIIAASNKYIFSDLADEGSDKKRFYIIEIFEHKIGFVPAKRFGTIFDPLTRNRTCIPLIFAAEPYFEKSIKAMSEFDLTNCLHTFPQKIVYSDPCPGEPMSEGQFIGCQNGLRPDGKTTCSACKGTGFKGHTSAADVIQVRMPKDIKDIVSLENLIAYKTPPIELLQFQKEYGFYELRQLAQGAVYNSDVFSREQIVKTATEKTIDLDAVYDTLTSYADTGSEIYEHIYKCIASIRDISDKLTIKHQFPSDFKMESFDMLLGYLQKANSNGATSYIKKAINRKIIHKIYADEQREVLKIETKDKYFPFAGKTETEINYIIANDLTSKYNKIFHCNFDAIFSELEYESGLKSLDFYSMDETQQRDLIAAKVQSYIDTIEEEDAAAAAIGFNSASNTVIATVTPPTTGSALIQV